MDITKKQEIGARERANLKEKRRVVVKVGSSSLAHPGTENLDLTKLEVLVRELTDLRNRGMDVVLVTSGAMMAGRRALGYEYKPERIAEKQACAAVGQARLMMIYQKLFAEYSQVAAQILLTKSNVLDEITRRNATNTFEQLLAMHVIPIVNENDTVATSELYDVPFLVENDTLAAVVSVMIDADLLILMSDIDGLYTDDPKKTPDAAFISTVLPEEEHYFELGRGPGSKVGTGGMQTKLLAAKIAAWSGIDMVIANSKDFRNIHRIIEGEDIGTLFLGEHRPDFSLPEILKREEQRR